MEANASAGEESIDVDLYSNNYQVSYALAGLGRAPILRNLYF